MVFPPTLKVGVLQIKNVLEIVTNANGSISISGAEGKFLEILCLALKIKYELVTSEDKQFGALNKLGKWTGILGLLEKNEADIAFGLYITEQRREVFDFSIPYLIEEVTFMVAKESSTVDKHPFLEAFDGLVWVCILGSFIVAGVVYSLTRNCSVVQAVFDFLSILLRQSVKIKDCKVRDTIMYTSWLLFAFVISSSYLAIFLSHLALPVRSQPLQSFMDVANAVQRGTHRCLVSKGSAVSAFLKSSKEEHLRTLFENIEKNNWFFKGLDALSVESVKDSVVVLDRPLLQALVTRLGMESYELSNDVLMSPHIAIAFRKDFCCKKKLNKVLNRLRTAGILQKLLSDQQSMNRIRASFRNLEKSNERQTFVKEIYHVFIMNVLIFVAAFFVLIIEIVYYRLHEKRKQGNVD